MIKKIINKFCSCLDAIGKKIDDVFDFQFDGYPKFEKKKKNEKKTRL